ncbi:hypothetical protein GN244_ATG06982 [Phytophthora infestans]|uniref:Uncharacterized protein n=1 Tax=Phytophthora infestans TaxID=4787 RepID=A0A833W3H1_PHYIN|nr:hypothetical protein GN244_ATG06982 [Phytophthora infestans]
MLSDGGVIAVENATSTEAVASHSGKSKRKKGFCFLPSSDIFPLIKTIRTRRGQQVTQCEQVASDLNAALTGCTADGKACRRRLTALLDVFRREAMKSLRASGTAEEYTEHDLLLTDITALDKYDITEKERREAERCELASAEVVRDAMVSLGRSLTSEYGSEERTAPTPKRQKRTRADMIAEYCKKWRAASRRLLCWRIKTSWRVPGIGPLRWMIMPSGASTD